MFVQHEVDYSIDYRREKEGFDEDVERRQKSWRAANIDEMSNMQKLCKAGPCVFSGPRLAAQREAKRNGDRPD